METREHAQEDGEGRGSGIDGTVEENRTDKFGFTQIFHPQLLLQPFSLAVEATKERPT